MSSFILNNEDSESDLGILNFIKKIKSKEPIVFETSGTTDKPKQVSHTFESLTKNIKVKEELSNTIWGLTYDYRKIAGSQVILQSYLNNGKLVNLFGKSNDEIGHIINKYNVTHISATPTFYRLLINQDTFKNVIQITLGGEVVSETLLYKIKKAFPNAKIRNIYALTEFGTLIASDTFYFEISEKNSNFIKIENNHIFVKDVEWIDTGDVVDMIDNTKFKIIGREFNMINVGGVKVNPIRIENVINSLSYVKNSFVYSKENSVMGKVVTADIVLNEINSISNIKNDLKKHLTQYELPLKINIVDKIEMNSTGKIIRK
jgi:acyl-CoA synthetase (AMP-forming)/AMP-acid ligase II